MLSSLGEPAVNSKRIAQLKQKLELEDLSLMEQSQSGSSDDTDDILDEELCKKLKAQNGQVICVYILVPSNN